MNAQAKNIAVGITVMGAIAVLAIMIVMFAGLPEVFERGYRLGIKTGNTGGILKGDIVHLSGVQIGKITRIRFVDAENPLKGVIVTAIIQSQVLLPGNTQAFISRGAVGPAYINLSSEGPARIDPATGKTIETLPTDGTAMVEGKKEVSGLMAELKPAMDSLGKLADSISSLLEPADTPRTAPAGIDPSTQPAAGLPEGLAGTIVRLNRTLDAVYAIVGDQQAQADAKATLRNLAGAAEQAKALVATMNTIAMKIDSGDGTAGKLINDPKLYNSLVTATVNLDRMLKELHKMIAQWRQEGVPVKM